MDAGIEPTGLWAYQGVLVLVALGLFTDLLWGRWTQAAITGLVVDLAGSSRRERCRPSWPMPSEIPWPLLPHWQPGSARPELVSTNQPRTTKPCHRVLQPS
jgi:hypothetical protein